MSALETEGIAYGYGVWNQQHEQTTLRRQKRPPNCGRRFLVAQLLGHLRLC